MQHLQCSLAHTVPSIQREGQIKFYLVEIILI
jgi:hypothetical protein